MARASEPPLASERAKAKSVSPFERRRQQLLLQLLAAVEGYQVHALYVGAHAEGQGGQAPGYLLQDYGALRAAVLGPRSQVPEAQVQITLLSQLGKQASGKASA
ncbi:MAG: hypothetical protein V8T45_04395 [Oscillospiraceae bacterium]